MNENKRGFTLIELIIALSIISILIFLALINYAVAVHKSEDIACQANLKTIRKAINVYYVNTGDYPNSLDDLKPDYIRPNFKFKCPRSKLNYSYNPTTHQVTCTYSLHANY
jgi:general secretion pathway protein G